MINKDQNPSPNQNRNQSLMKKRLPLIKWIAIKNVDFYDNNNKYWHSKFQSFG